MFFPHSLTYSLLVFVGRDPPRVVPPPLFGNAKRLTLPVTSREGHKFGDYEEEERRR